MRTIELEKIIAKSGISITDMGRHLFPKVLQPYQAIQRVLKGETSLNTEQIVKLSEVTGVPIANLFTES